jgi:hypothetical protein
MVTGAAIKECDVAEGRELFSQGPIKGGDGPLYQIL